MTCNSVRPSAFLHLSSPPNATAERIGRRSDGAAIGRSGEQRSLGS